VGGVLLPYLLRLSSSHYIAQTNELGANRIRERERHKKYENLLRIRQRGRRFVLRIFRLHHKMIGLCYFGHLKGPVPNQMSLFMRIVNCDLCARLSCCHFLSGGLVFYAVLCLITHCWKMGKASEIREKQKERKSMRSNTSELSTEKDWRWGEN